jgi:hypothetical protein
MPDLKTLMRIKCRTREQKRLLRRWNFAPHAQKTCGRRPSGYRPERTPFRPDAILRMGAGQCHAGL